MLSACASFDTDAAADIHNTISCSRGKREALRKAERESHSTTQSFQRAVPTRSVSSPRLPSCPLILEEAGCHGCRPDLGLSSSARPQGSADRGHSRALQNCHRARAGAREVQSRSRARFMQCEGASIAFRFWRVPRSPLAPVKICKELLTCPAQVRSAAPAVVALSVFCFHHGRNTLKVVGQATTRPIYCLQTHGSCPRCSCCTLQSIAFRNLDPRRSAP